MTLTALLIIILVIFLIGALPPFGYAPNYYPSGALGLIVLVLLILVLTGRL